MISHFAANAILTKVRTRYGNRLTKQNYQELLSCSTVNDVASLLRGYKSYGDVLKDYRGGTIHRGQLEAMLEKSLYDEYLSLYKFGLFVGAELIDYMLAYGEIKQLLRYIRYLIAGNTSEYIYAMSGFFNKHTSVDLAALSKISTYDGFLSFIKDTLYFNTFQKFSVANMSNFDFSGLETQLYKELYDRLFYKINGNHEYTNNELVNFYKTKIELQNVNRIYRMKNYYHMDKFDIIPKLLPYSMHISQLKLEQMIDADSSDEMIQIFKTTFYRNDVSKILFNNIDELISKLEYISAKKTMRFSKNANVVSTCYTTLKEIELRNIINVIEGKRYELPTAEIKKMLIGVNI